LDQSAESMNTEESKKIEEIFRNSESHDELFDAFQIAVNIKFRDPEVFKILIANPVLSPDEIKMFTEKLINVIPEQTYNILMWTGKIFESHPNHYDHLEDAFNYYNRAISHQPESFMPYLRLLNLYNYEIDYPMNRKIIGTIENLASKVDQKSKVYYALSAHYKKCGNKDLEAEYLAMAEKETRRETQIL